MDSATLTIFANADDDAAMSDDDGVCLSACDSSLDLIQEDFEDLNDDVLDALNTILQTMVSRYSRRRLTADTMNKRKRISETISLLSDSIGERLDEEVFNAVRVAFTDKLDTLKESLNEQLAPQNAELDEARRVLSEAKKLLGLDSTNLVVPTSPATSLYSSPSFSIHDYVSRIKESFGTSGVRLEVATITSGLAFVVGMVAANLAMRSRHRSDIEKRNGYTQIQ